MIVVQAASVFCFWKPHAILSSFEEMAALERPESMASASAFYNLRISKGLINVLLRVTNNEVMQVKEESGLGRQLDLSRDIPERGS